MGIKNIAVELNKRAKNFKINNLQNIRKEIKGLERRAGSDIFNIQTIDSNGNWAFHYGGRKEIQFNIGIDNISGKNQLRYGLAFSLEESQSLPDISILYPSIRKLNILIQEEPYLFQKYKMWVWSDGSHFGRHNVYEISEELIQVGNFIFFGKLMDLDTINYDEILSTLDDLLDIYIKVEDKQKLCDQEISNNKKFEFEKKESKLPESREYSAVEKEINLTIRHSALQRALYNKLVSEYGEENVSLEHPIGTKRIDIVVKKDQDYIFYEVKIGSSAKSCIRQAVGQLLEYAYYYQSDLNVSLVIAGEHCMDQITSNYLEVLKEKFHLPITYEEVTFE